MKSNFILSADSYKFSHCFAYPENMKGMFSYVESRGGEFESVRFFGLQYFLKEYLSKPITLENVREAAELLAAHGEPFDTDGWEYIVKVHGGYIPVLIRAVPEGCVIPTSNVLVTVESTDGKVPWITSWVETALLRAIWYPTTVCTLSHTIRKTIENWLYVTSDDGETALDFKLHDFGLRGVSSRESGAIGGLAHLVNFKGTDNLEALQLARQYYGNSLAGLSVPASEHSTITAFGKEGELEAYRAMLEKYGKPGAIFSVVCDSYDLWNALGNLWGETLKQNVIDSGATVVLRLDSGNPVDVVCKSLEILNEKFGSTVNSKGYRVLNHVRVLQGDGINLRNIHGILCAMKKAGYAASNIVFGMGGALLQGVNRDTLRFAMKCSAVKIGYDWRAVRKEPITDAGKRSKAGRLDLVKDVGGNYRTIAYSDEYNFSESVMRTVYDNGLMLIDDSLDEIRARQ